MLLFMFPTCISPLDPFRSVPEQNYGLCGDISSFHGEIVDQEEYKRGKIDMKVFLPWFLARHPKESRFPEIESYVKSLKQEHGFKKIGAIGFCWGRWAVFQLGAKGNSSRLIERPRSAKWIRLNVDDQARTWSTASLRRIPAS